MLHSQARVIADTICQVTLATSLFLMDDCRQEISATRRSSRDIATQPKGSAHLSHRHTRVN